MTILDDAIGLEERARTYYTEAASRVIDPSGKKILNLLANEEAKHASILAEMKGGSYGKLAGSTLANEVRHLVEGTVKEGKDAISTDSSLREILQKAMEIESATKQFYKEKGSTASDPKEKELFAFLAKQETIHSRLVSSLSEYFDRPAEWVESAEFGLRQEY